MPFDVWLLALASIALSALAQLSMKVGMGRITAAGDGGLWTIATSPFVLGGLALYGVGAMLWLAVLARVPLSMAYPLVSIGFVFVAILSFAVLGETLPTTRLLGILLIVGGVALVGAR